MPDPISLADYRAQKQAAAAHVMDERLHDLAAEALNPEITHVLVECAEMIRISNELLEYRAQQREQLQQDIAVINAAWGDPSMQAALSRAFDEDREIDEYEREMAEIAAEEG